MSHDDEEEAEEVFAAFQRRVDVRPEERASRWFEVLQGEVTWP